MAEIKDTNEKDLHARLIERQTALNNFRFGLSGSKVKNVKEGRGIRKEIARILTELNARKNK